MKLITSVAIIVWILTWPANGASSTLRCKLVWVLNDQFAGELYSYYNGWYKNAGINLVLQPYNIGARDPYSGVMTGQSEIGLADTVSVLKKAISDHADIVIFGVEDQISPAGFLSLKEANISNPQDLGGRTFGYYNDGDIDLLKWYADINSVDFKSIHMAKVNPNDMTPLLDGSVDFIMAHETNEPIILKLNGHDTNFLSLSTRRGLHLGSAFFCKKTFYEHNQRLLMRFMQVTARGWRAALDRPAEAAKIVIAQYPFKAYINGSRKLTIEKFMTGLRVKNYYITYNVGLDCIGCISKIYWDIVRDKLISESVIKDDTDIIKYIRFDVAKGAGLQ